MKSKIEVMRVQRMPPLGKLAVEVRDNQYESLAEVPDPATRQRLLAAIGELIVFAGGYQVLADAGVAPPLPAAGTGPAKPAAPSAPDADDAPTPEQEAFLRRLQEERDRAAEPAVNSQISILNSLRRRPEPPPKPMSLAQQIDAILQEKVDSHPKFAGRSIHLLPDPQGGLRIEIDGRRYERPSQIEEKEIAILIKMAISEWEKKP